VRSGLDSVKTGWFAVARRPRHATAAPITPEKKNAYPRYFENGLGVFVLSMRLGPFT
jgi:hypothetical protein